MASTPPIMAQDWHVRGTPSTSDQDLIDTLAQEGIFVSHSQLERWRNRGLLPRSILVRPTFGGSRVEPHPDGVFEAAAVLAQASSRGRPWQYVAMHLFDCGHDMSTEAVRQTALFLIDLQVRHLRRAWRLAERAVGPVMDPDDELADLGFYAATHSGPTVKKMVYDEVVLAHPYATEAEKRELSERALIWRMVDIHLPARMTEEQKNLARHGTEEPMDVFGVSGILPLPSERVCCAETLSWAEANVFREVAALRVRELSLEAVSLFSLTTWLVTGARMNENPRALDLPLPQEFLMAEQKSVEAAWTQVGKDTPPREESLSPALFI